MDRNKEKNVTELIEYILNVVLMVPAMFFLYFAFIPQYGIRDHEGYLGGAIVLAGHIALVIITNFLKGKLLSEKKSDYIYFFSIINVIATLICIRTLLFYHSRLYVLSLAIFMGIPLAFVIIRQLMIMHGKVLHINYMESLYLAGVLAGLSTVVRGMYIFRWQMLITLVLCVLLLAGEISGVLKSESELAYFPYDFEGWKTETKSDFVKKYKVACLIVTSWVVLYLLLGPLEIYAGNMLSFSFGYKTFLPLFLLIGVAVIVFLSAFIALFTQKTFKFICVLLTTFSLLSYVQCMFMNTKLMEEDGSRLRLDTMGNYPTINLILWIIIAMVVVVVLILVKEKWTIAICGICAFISAIQMVAVISLVITCMNSPAPRYYQLTGDKMFSVAKKENVIVLMPDTFAREYLKELLDDDPTYMDIFKDFTYYDNMNCEYFPTFPAVIHILTGYERTENVGSGLSKERVQWQTDAWNSGRCQEFVNILKDSGYKYLVNIPSACELLGAYEDVKGKVDNVEYAESNVCRPVLLKMLFSMSIYRCVPYLVKPPFEFFSWDFAELERYEGKTAAYRNEDFYKEVCEGITVDESIEKELHVINWHGFHEEYTNDEYCNHVDDAENNGISQLQNEKG